MWEPYRKIFTTISICVLLGVGVPSSAGNPADEIAGYPPGKPSSINYYSYCYTYISIRIS